MFKIDTGAPEQSRPRAKSAEVDDTMRVSLASGQRAERLHRQIIANIYACETRTDLSDYVSEEAPILDEMRRMWPDYHQLIEDAFEEHRACIGA